MPQSPFTPAESARQRWQFSIRGMLIFTVSVAMGASVWQSKLSCWTSQGTVNYPPGRQEFLLSGLTGGVLAIFLFWLIAGLAYQIRDLWAFLTSNPPIDQEQRRGVRFEIFWRTSVVLLLVLYALLAVLLNQGFLDLSDKRTGYASVYGGVSDLARETVFLLLMMVIVGSVPAIRRKPRFPPLSWLINLIAWALAIGICLKCWKNETEIHHLVHIATISIDTSTPLKYSLIDPRHYYDRCLFFYHWSVISGVLVLLNWICLRCAARQRSAGIFRRGFWSLLFLSGTTAVSVFLIWLLGHGLGEVSPFYAETSFQQPNHCWIAIGLIFLLLATAMTYPLAVDYSPTLNVPTVSWRRDRNKYFHEWRTVLLGLAIALVCFRIQCGYEVSWHTQQLMPASVRWMPVIFSERFFAETFFGRPVDFLWTALICLTIFRAFSRRYDAKNPLTEVPRLNGTKFVAVWLASLVFTISGALTLIWMSFGLWFDLWFRK